MTWCANARRSLSSLLMITACVVWGTGTLIYAESIGFYVQDYHLLWCDFPDTSANLTFITPNLPPQPPALIFDQSIPANL